MKILGIGIDIIKNDRIRSLVKNKKFILRTFSKNEIINAKKLANKTNFFAKRFAAKESFVKSIGSGFRNNINLRDIEIFNDKMGQPYYFKSKKINEIIKKKFKTTKYNLFLSISDEKDYSIAFTILQI